MGMHGVCTTLVLQIFEGTNFVPNMQKPSL